MEELKIPDEAINIAMEKAGFPYAQDPWNSLWVYFQRVWISQFSPAVWNMHGLNNSIIVRTNSPLDHFQRELESSFTAPDPGLQFFVATTKGWHVVMLLILQERRVLFPMQSRCTAVWKLQVTKGVLGSNRMNMMRTKSTTSKPSLFY
ncbi:uncharacterized protein PITG_10439 [Phytophthora infestans T30-4]|uniref:Uncharacterized protein n=1 Tax=Phytophthora infestans (strain T30-4) TaxID=403677 RepID=D0NFB1_PHYIT|nr:uncharacterized protein PITG_10439 [Phytophthora infestans T30-4]EEY56900.1 hypothetical protein PITG_10439 [Phytophthora infestans T30-4]|eukprot:XP_002902228.1 hypothetical protein PITG_10439 [Phytophthora infestans T30-4]